MCTKIVYRKTTFFIYEVRIKISLAPKKKLENKLKLSPVLTRRGMQAIHRMHYLRKTVPLFLDSAQGDNCHSAFVSQCGRDIKSFVCDPQEKEMSANRKRYQSIYYTCSNPHACHNLMPSIVCQ